MNTNPLSIVRYLDAADDDSATLLVPAAPLESHVDEMPYVQFTPVPISQQQSSSHQRSLRSPPVAKFGDTNFKLHMQNRIIRDDADGSSKKFDLNGNHDYDREMVIYDVDEIVEKFSEHIPVVLRGGAASLRKYHGLVTPVLAQDDFYPFQTLLRKEHPVGTHAKLRVILNQCQSKVTLMGIGEFLKAHHSRNSKSPMNVLDLTCKKLPSVLPGFVRNRMSFGHALHSSVFFGTMNKSDRANFNKCSILLSESGCQTDFHCDMSGTAVMYIMLKGTKTFFLIPPTHTNINLMEEWDTSGTVKSSTFFGDVVDENNRTADERCISVTMVEGDVLFLSPNYIHAVLTTGLSIAMGANFVPCQFIKESIKSYTIEREFGDPFKLCLPNFEILLLGLMWSVATRDASCLKNIAMPHEELGRYAFDAFNKYTVEKDRRRIVSIFNKCVVSFFHTFNCFSGWL